MLRILFPSVLLATGKHLWANHTIDAEVVANKLVEKLFDQEVKAWPKRNLFPDFDKAWPRKRLSFDDVLPKEGLSESSLMPKRKTREGEETSMGSGAHSIVKGILEGVPAPPSATKTLRRIEMLAETEKVGKALAQEDEPETPRSQMKSVSADPQTAYEALDPRYKGSFLKANRSHKSRVFDDSSFSAVAAQGIIRIPGAALICLIVGSGVALALLHLTSSRCTSRGRAMEFMRFSIE